MAPISVELGDVTPKNIEQVNIATLLIPLYIIRPRKRVHAMMRRE